MWSPNLIPGVGLVSLLNGISGLRHKYARRREKPMLVRVVKSLIRELPPLYRIAKVNYFALKGYFPIFLDYPVNPIPRYGYGKPPHSKLYGIINENRVEYENRLEKFLEFKEYFWKIPVNKPRSSREPFWMNDWVPALDTATLYSLLCLNNPKRYYEIGSGNSTKFARRAIIDHNLKTRITAIDPHPRAEIASICDTVINRPLEELDLSLFDELENNDILFIDASHRLFMNSDVAVTFLDVLPRLDTGVLVEFHDILLPYDYPPAWQEFYFSEQYLLAACLLAEGGKFSIVLPNFFVSNDLDLSESVTPIWDHPLMETIRKCDWSHGWSFWIQTK